MAGPDDRDAACFLVFLQLRNANLFCVWSQLPGARNFIRRIRFRRAIQTPKTNPFV